MAEKPLDELSSQQLFEFARQAPEPLEAEAQPVAEPTPVPAEPAPVAPVVPSPPPDPGEAPIPSWRLREEAEARRVAEDRARTLEQRLNEVAAHLQQQQKKPDFFENPDAATNALVQRAIQPLAEETRKMLLHMGKSVAVQIHGADKVATAEKAFLDAMNAGALNSVDYERVVQSPNRYDEVVRWHTQQHVQTVVGNDPVAWFKSELARQLADPKSQAEILEMIRGKVAAKPGAVQIPPSLSKATAAAGNSGEPMGDMSDTSLFAHAMRRT